MIRYMIKNNCKLMLRNRWVLVTMLLGPILVIAALSSAFGEMMTSYEAVEEYTVGYRMGETSVFAPYMDAVREAGEENGISFVQYPDGEPEELMRQNELAGFLVLGEDTYTVYESADYPVEGAGLEYFMGQVERQMEQRALQMLSPSEAQEDITLPVRTLEFMPAIDAGNYYGIIEVVYFLWVGVISAAGILASEKKYGINRRFQVTAVSESGMYLAKWMPSVVITAGETALTMVLSSALFGVRWGNLPLTALVLMLGAMGAVALGLFLYALCRNLAVMVVALFTLVWFMGFAGGSFETYMYSSLPEGLKLISPIYHVNRALVEYSCMGRSDYTVSSVLYMSGITIVCTLLAVGINTIRKKGRA